MEPSRLIISCAACPRGSYHIAASTSCNTRTTGCLYGGVSKIVEDPCICPMLFFGEENGRHCIYSNNNDIAFIVIIKRSVECNKKLMLGVGGGAVGHVTLILKRNLKNTPRHVWQN